MDDSHQSAGREVDLILFEVGGHTFGAAVADVVGVGAPSPGRRAVFTLGDPADGRRAILVRDASGQEVEVPVDRVLGFQRAGPRDLRRLPEFARGLAEPAVVGVLFRDGNILVLLDLETLVNQGPAGAPALPGSRAA